jgi:hypothetical protein
VKRIIKRHEKQAKGELAHIDTTKLPKDIRCSCKIKELYPAALCDDCTRITDEEVKNFPEQVDVAPTLKRIMGLPISS